MAASCGCEDPFFCNHGKATTNKVGAKYFSINKLSDPIEEQIKDSKEAAKLFKTLPFIPYAGTNEHSSDQLLKFLYLLKNLSSSKGACNSSIREFAFHGLIEIRKAVNESFLLDKKSYEVSEEEKLKYVNFIETLDLNANSLNDLASILYDGTDVTGDHYLKVVISKIGDGKAGMYVLDNQHCRYVNNGQQNRIAVSSNWSYNYIAQNIPKIYPVYPEVKEDELTITFIIHSKNTTGFYGRPKSNASLFAQFIETQEDMTRLTSSYRRFMADIIMEVEDADPSGRRILDGDAQKAGFEDVEERLNYQYSNQNIDSPSLMLLGRPYGSSPALIHETKIDTKEKYFEASRKLTRDDIFINHNWSQKLAGVPMATGWSNDEFINELKVKQPTVKKAQSIAERTINTALKYICLYFKNGLDKYCINFLHPYEELLKETKDNGNTSEKLGNN